MAQQVNYTTPGTTTTADSGISALAMVLIILGLIVLGYFLFTGRSQTTTPDTNVNIRTEQPAPTNTTPSTGGTNPGTSTQAP